MKQRTVAEIRSRVADDGRDQRTYLRLRVEKSIELKVGTKIHAGKTYDIGQGGLCFVVPELYPMTKGPATVSFSDADFCFKGQILVSHQPKFGDQRHFHFQFDDVIDLATMAVVMGI